MSNLSKKALLAALTTLMVNARHLFYGISMIEKYRDTGWRNCLMTTALRDGLARFILSSG